MNKINSILSNKISLWLWSCVFLLVVIILIGGITRLTDSGLSITEWKPFIGIIPPLNHQSWLFEFTKYQQTPEYNFINYGMTIDEFKSIYLMEYIHRVLARLIGILFLIPFIYFLYKRNFNKFEISTLSIAFIFGIAQAFAGWYMVKSGLVNQPHVDHFRLSIHLTIALIIISLFLITIFARSKKTPKISSKFNLSLKILQILIFIQIILGSLVAGLDAGMIYNEFPLMGDCFIPDEIINQTIVSSFLSPAIVQFMHRIIAYIIFIMTCYIYYLYRIYSTAETKSIFKILFFIVLSQILTGILTLLLHVPVSFASIHQGIGILLHCIVLYLNYSFYKKQLN